MALKIWDLKSDGPQLVEVRWHLFLTINNIEKDVPIKMGLNYGYAAISLAA
jgi:hypothetical protein